MTSEVGEGLTAELPAPSERVARARDKNAAIHISLGPIGWAARDRAAIAALAVAVAHVIPIELATAKRAVRGAGGDPVRSRPLER